MANLPAADKKIVQRQLILLPPRTKAAQEKEMGEMMGKLKDVSNYLTFQNRPANNYSLEMAY
jgi:hypothetical protein